MSFENKNLRTAIVGFGKLGLLHLSQFSANPKVDVIGVCENDNSMYKILVKT